MKNVMRSARELKKVLPRNKTFCLVGGCFDLIHVGHLHLLEYAAKLENLLVVAVLSDEYARDYKDLNRPIINQRQRATMVASIKDVDYVYVSNISPSSPEVLSLLRPDSIVFCKEAGNEKRLRQRIAQVRRSSPDTKIRLLARYDEEEVSTSYIIKKIRGK